MSEVTICVKCSNYMEGNMADPGDRCFKATKQRIDFVTGERVSQSCREINTDGHCPHYKARAGRRIAGRGWSE